MTRYTIWHDADYDLARWLQKNTVLKNERVLINEMPKTNKFPHLETRLEHDNDTPLLPLIKYEHPDLVIMEEVGGECRPVCIAELMTHTPQWQHPAQRFARIYGAANHGVPAALIAPRKKSKMEKSRAGRYGEVVYKLSPSVEYLFQTTTRITGTPAMIFGWTDKDGYLRLDRHSPTAPRPDNEIITWFDFIKKCVQREKITTGAPEYDNPPSAISKYTSLSAPADTGDYLASKNMDEANLTFDLCKRYLLFSPQGLSPPTSYFRTDPYAGMLCAFDNMFCRDPETGNRLLNLFLRAKNVSMATLAKNGTFVDLGPHDAAACPFETFSHDLAGALRHMDEGCPFTGSKQQRIYGQVADLIDFDDVVYQRGGAGRHD